MGQKQTKLTSSEFKEILDGTKFSKEEINDWLMKFRNEFPRGRIRKYEFLVIYAKLFPQGDATEFTDHIFRTYDQNGDGVIDFREFMVTVSIAQRGTTEEKLKWAFRLYDLDGNGTLNREEVKTVLTSIYKARKQPNPVEKAELSTNEFFIGIDFDKDGTITESEFINGIDNCPSLKELLKGF